jgi:SAM-dependent methyltransferase
MHFTAMENAKAFFGAYVDSRVRAESLTVVDIGAQDVNGSLKELVRPPHRYVGVDFVAAPGVDVVLDDPYKLPFPDGSVDVVLSSSCFEHSEMFWVLFLEILRILKPAGLFYLNVPSNGDIHRFPVDCWRFYPDSGQALVSWAKRSGFAPRLLESYVSSQAVDNWNDYVAVFVRDESCASQYPNRILQSKADVFNGRTSGSLQVVNPADQTEDHQKMRIIEGVIQNRFKIQLKA